MVRVSIDCGHIGCFLRWRCAVALVPDVSAVYKSRMAGFFADLGVSSG